MKWTLSQFAPAFYRWWDQEIVGNAVDRFASKGSGAPHRRITYSAEERETMKSLLAAPSPRRHEQDIDERARAPSYLALGKFLELMELWKLDHFEDVEIEVNLDPRWSKAHPEWERLLLRTWTGTSRQLCVWVRPKPP